MPLTKKGRKIMRSMRKTYGGRAKEVLYRSKNKGTIKGVCKPRSH
ncbi:MAG: hypothetical protein ACYTDW_14460 [Planctomycetota bacterium]|jgi:hypothetical protein